MSHHFQREFSFRVKNEFSKIFGFCTFITLRLHTRNNWRLRNSGYKINSKIVLTVNFQCSGEVKNCTRTKNFRKFICYPKFPLKSGENSEIPKFSKIKMFGSCTFVTLMSRSPVKHFRYRTSIPVCVPSPDDHPHLQNNHFIFSRKS